MPAQGPSREARRPRVPCHHYHVVSRWRLQASLDDVARIVGDSESLARWWPAAFLEARVVAVGGADDVGKTVWLRAGAGKGVRPGARLRWRRRLAHHPVAKPLATP